jgi:hypothetical protein
MAIEEAPQEFTFKSSALATVITRCFGLLVMWVSVDFLGAWLNPSWDRLPYMLLLFPFGFLLLAAGGLLLLGTCDIEILDGQFRFRRLFIWNSLPLTSITRMRLVLGTGIVRLDYAGKCYRVIFNPEDFRVRAHPSPVINFLREACNQNAGRTRSSA